MGLFGPAWNSKKTDKALAAIEKISDPAELFKAATSATDSKVRLAAVKKFTDIATLERILSFEKDFDTRQRIMEWERKCRVNQVEAITDKKELKRIALTEGANDIAEAAARKLTDSKDLVEVASSAKASVAAKIAVEKIGKDQEKLYSVVMNSKIIGEAARLAFERITESELLEKIALDQSAGVLRSEAVKRIDNIDVLADIARESGNKKPSLEAIEKIDDESVLIEVAMGDEQNEKVIKAALKVKDPDAFEKIIRKHPWMLSKISRKDCERIKDPLVFFDIAADESLRFQIRREAVMQIKDYDQILKLSESCQGYDIQNLLRDRKKSLERTQGLCPSCAHPLSPEENSKCRCDKCGAEVHDYESVMENVVDPTPQDSYYRNDVYHVCKRCGHKVFVIRHEGWGTDVD